MAVELDVANPSGKLSAGMFAQVAWSMRRPQPSLFVPTSAIATTTKGVSPNLGYAPLPGPQSLGEPLKVWRLLRAMPQRELARRLGVDQGTLGRWERGTRQPTGKWLVAVQASLDATA